MAKINNLTIVEKEYEFFWGSGTRKYAEISITNIAQCGACGKNFDSIELVFYTPTDNSVICKSCTESHGSVEPRLYVEGVS